MDRLLISILFVALLSSCESKIKNDLKILKSALIEIIHVELYY